ncbi:MAG: pentapeptide repeat-containing protein [Proteobacteria bacterium]|nr:pentapeptide repeat-containing protein [Pseudomonadota bacterium]
MMKTMMKTMIKTMPAIVFVLALALTTSCRGVEVTQSAAVNHKSRVSSQSSVLGQVGEVVAQGCVFEYNGSDIPAYCNSRTSECLQAVPPQTTAVLECAGASIPKVNLVEKDLRYANFYEANLKNSYLVMTNFLGVNGEWAHFDRAVAGLANFSHAKLTGADFRFSQLPNAVFSQSHLLNAQFVGANLIEADFYDANLRGVTFHHANLQRTNFQNAYLKDTSFGFADLRGANFTGAQEIESADFRAAKHLDAAIGLPDHIVESYSFK